MQQLSNEIILGSEFMKGRMWLAPRGDKLIFDIILTNTVACFIFNLYFCSDQLREGTWGDQLLWPLVDPYTYVLNE